MRGDWSGRQSVLAALMLILLDFSGGATAVVPSEEIAPGAEEFHPVSESLPPLYCGDVICEPKDRTPYLPPYNVEEWTVRRLKKILISTAPELNIVLGEGGEACTKKTEVSLAAGCSARIVYYF